MYVEGQERADEWNWGMDEGGARVGGKKNRTESGQEDRLKARNPAGWDGREQRGETDKPDTHVFEGFDDLLFLDVGVLRAAVFCISKLL